MTKKPRLLTWRRTVIGGKTIPDDYYGELEGSPGFCRIYDAVAHTQRPDGWQWFANGDRFIAQGFEEELERAVEAAETAYARWRETPARGRGR